VASNILHAATSIIGNLIKPMIIACNNIWVDIDGNNCSWSCKESQSQADLNRCTRQPLARLPLTVAYKHVDAHQDNIKTWASLTLLQQLNVIADQLTKDTLICDIAIDNLTAPNFPFESQWQESDSIHQSCTVLSLGHTQVKTFTTLLEHC
jgi:hypothetical protein